MKIHLIPLFLCLAGCFSAPFLHANSSKLQLDLAIQLYQEEDYYRSISELLNLQFQTTSPKKKDKILLYLVKNYYKLNNFPQLSSIAPTILQSPNPSFRKEAGLVLSFSYLKQGEEQESKKVWEKHVAEKSDPNFPLIENLEDLVDPNEAKLYSTLFPGAGFLVTGEYQKGAVSFFLNFIFLSAIYQHTQQKNYGIAGLLLFFEVGWYNGGRRASYESALNYNQRRINQQRLLWMEKRQTLFQYE